MPNYDLGTARGRIKVDSDTRGAKLADRALQAFERTVRALSGRMSAFEDHMNAMERELNDAAREFETTGRAAHGYERGVRDADRASRDFSNGIVDLHHRLRGLHRTTEQILPPSLQLLRVWREFSQTSGGFGNLVASIHRTGGTAQILSMLTARFIGMGAAIETVTGKQRKLIQFASGFRTFAFVGGFIAATAAKMGLFEKTLGRLFRQTIEGDHALLGFKNTLERFTEPIRRVINNLDRMALGTVQFIGGMALMRRGTQQLMARFGALGGMLRGMPGWMKAAVAGAIIFAKALEQILAKALVTVSNLLVDLAAAAKQLSGGFLAIPGGIAMAVAAIGTLKAIISPMKKQFQDLIKAIGEGDQAAIGEALTKLPEHLKPLGQVIADILPKWKALQMALQATFVGGADVQLRALSEAWLPAISRGAEMVANSWRMAKDQVVAFLSQAQTVSDTQRIFMNTSQTMNNFKDSIRPALEGMRDLAAVGSEFLRNLSAGLPNIMDRFAEWARLNRENGNLMRWMTDAWRGTKDLVNGLKDAGKATWTLLTLFKDRSGEGSLERFANAMERFNNAVQKSAAGGVLKEIGDAVRNMGTDKIRELWDIIKTLAGALKDLVPFVSQVSEGFRDVMVPAIKLAVGIIRQVLDVLNEFGGGRVIGWILGLVGAWKLMGTVLGPLRNVVQIFIGAFTGFKGAQNLVLGLAGTLENFGSIGQRASNSILKVGDSLATWGTRLGIAGLAIGGLVMGIQGAQNDINKWNDLLKQSAANARDFKDDLNKAFVSDRGLVGKTVFDTVTTGMDTMMADLQAKADQVPGFMENFKATVFGGGKKGDPFLSGMGPFSLAQGNEFNALQKGAQDAEKAKGAFDRLGVSNENLAAIVTGSQARFHEFVATVRDSGDGGNEAATELDKLHDTYTRMQVDFQKAGPGAALLADGIRQIAQAGGDADTKLTGMKLALQGLGLDKTSQYENAIALAEAVNKIANEASTAADKSKPLDDIWGADGSLNAGMSANANNLFNLLSPAIEQFKRTAASGGDIGAAFKQITDQVPALAAAFQGPNETIDQTTQKIMGLINQLGGIPDVVGILVQLEGKDQVTQDLAQVVLWAQQNVGQGVGIPVLVKDPHGLEKEIETIFGDIADSTDNAISFKFNVDPAALAVLQQVLASHGVQMPGGPPAKPGTVPVQPGAPGPAPAGAPPPPPPKIAPPPADQAALDNANKTIGDLKRQLDELSNKPAKIQIDVGTLDEVRTKLQEVQRVFNDGKIEFTIVAKGYDETTAVVNQVKDAVTRLIEEVGKIAGKFQETLGQAQQHLNAFSGGMRDAGTNAGNAFAEGLQASFDSNVFPTLDRVLTEFKARFHSSPPKKGPLAAHGDAMLYGGTKAGTQFAAGIESAYPVAGKAADGLAGIVAGLPYRSGNFQVTPILGQLRSLLQFAQNAKGVFDNVSSLFFDAAKFIADPLGKGTFFGQSTGAAFGFKADPKAREEAARRREDENYAAIGTTHAGTGKAPGPTEITGEVTVAGADWDAIAQKESGGRWNLPSGTYDSTGGLQIRQGTWEAFGGLDVAPQPYMASKEDQIAIAEKILAKQGPQAWAGGKNFVPAKPGQTTRGAPGTFSDETLLSRVPKGRYSAVGDLTKGLGDCSSAVEDLVNMMDNQPTGGRQMSTANAAQWLAERGFVRGPGGLGDMRVAFNAGHMQATLPGGTPFNWGSDAAAALGGRTSRGADDPALTEQFYRPLGETAANTGQANDQNAQILASLRQQNVQLDEQIRVGQDPNSTDTQVANSLQMISQEIDKQNLNDTPAGRANSQALESIKSTIASDRGMTEQQNPMDQAASVISGISGVVGSVLEVFNATVEAIQATQNLADMVIRYPSNTEDIMQMIDDFQKYIELGAAIAGAVSSIAGMAGSMTGGMDMGITSAVGQVAGMVQAALEAINAGIDLAQEAWHIFGSYFGEFLGILAGGPGGALQGNVRYLLDQNAGQLYAYGQDNPQDKRGHNVPGMIKQPAYQQGIGQVNVYGGPGSDPRDNTRDMMFQVKAAGFAGATNG